MFVLDKKLLGQGLHIVAGCDEAGRGALAGPLIVAVVVLDLTRPLPAVKDSKQTTARQRDEMLREIQRLACAIGVGESPPAEIDSVGIDRATILAAQRVLTDLSDIDVLVCDRFKVAGYAGYQLNPVHAEAKSVAVAAASIVAKTHRDGLMDALDNIEPAYAFSRHKGYPTAFHLERLRTLGPSRFHRKSYRPVFDASKNA